MTLPHVDDDGVAERIVRSAHEICPYSNATRGNIEVVLRLDGRPLE